jgi:serine/threonine-protein kinase
MHSLDAEHWQRVSRHLDTVLELDADARHDYLARLQAEQPDCAAELTAILASRTASGFEAFLESAPAAVAELSEVSRFAGARLGPYVIEAEVGRGGMGTVWRARRADGQFEGHVAIKVLSAALVGKPAEQRLRREGSVLARLRHPNIAQLFDAGIAPSGQAYLVLEYIEGQRIDEYCVDRKLSVRERLILFMHVMAAVSYAHSQLIVHRDIKPTNILVSDDGRVRLLDFGIATLLRAEEDERGGHTVEGAAALTPDYAAPEQFLGETITTATDVYALGVVLFLLVTGRHPRTTPGESTVERIRAAVEDEIPGAATGSDLDNVLAKALRRDPRNRYASVDAFADDLRRYLAEEPVKARPDTLAYRASKFARRYRGSLVTATLVVLSLVGLSLFAWLQMNAARAQRDEAFRQEQRAEAEASFVTLMLDSMGESDTPLTMANLLDRGVELLDREYANDPAFRVHTLINMSGRYMDAGLTDREAAMLKKAEELARQTKDPALLAEVKCDSVETEISQGHLDASAQALEEGRTALERAGTPVELEVECLHAQGSLADAQGHVEEAEALVARAVALLEQRLPEKMKGVMYTGLLSHLSVLYMRQGKDRAALETDLKELRTLEQMGRLGTLHALATRNNIAHDLDDVGEVRGGLEQLGTVVRRDQANDTSVVLHPAVSQTYGLLLSRAGEHQLSLQWFERAVRDASAGAGGAGMELTARIRLAREHAVAGCVAAAAQDLAAIDSRVAGHEREFANAIRALPVARAEYELAKSDAPAAEAALAPLLASTAHPSAGDRGIRMRVLEVAVPAAIAQGRFQEAESLASEMLEMSRNRARNPAESFDVGEGYLSRAFALAAAGRATEARDEAGRAQAVLSASVGADHAWTRAAAQLASGGQAGPAALRPRVCAGAAAQL